jgi:hypothetical protein
MVSPELPDQNVRQEDAAVEVIEGGAEVASASS